MRTESFEGTMLIRSGLEKFPHDSPWVTCFSLGFSEGRAKSKGVSQWRILGSNHREQEWERGKWGRGWERNALLSLSQLLQLGLSPGRLFQTVRYNLPRNFLYREWSIYLLFSLVRVTRSVKSLTFPYFCMNVRGTCGSLLWFLGMPV